MSFLSENVLIDFYAITRLIKRKFSPFLLLYTTRKTEITVLVRFCGAQKSLQFNKPLFYSFG